MSKFEDVKDGFANKSLNRSHAAVRARMLYLITLPSIVASSIGGAFAGAVIFSPSQEKIRDTLVESCETQVVEALGTKGIGKGDIITQGQSSETYRGSFQRNADGSATCVFVTNGITESGASMEEIRVNLPALKM